MKELIEYPYSDALSPELPGERRDFRLKLTSTTVSLTAFPGDDGGRADGAPDGASLPVTARFDPKPSVETETVESRTLASITEEGGRIVLDYDDASDDSEPPIQTTLSFEAAEPGIVTLEREGFVRSVMIFEAGCRHRAIYKTPLGAFEMTVFSRSVENKLTLDGGTLTLDYAVEFRGAAEQKVRLSLEAVRLQRFAQ